MSRYRKTNTAVDANQEEIVKTLRQIPGVSVALGHDDILVGFSGKTYWYELKNPDGLNKLRPSQVKLQNEWTGHYRVVTTVYEIIDEISLDNPIKVIHLHHK